MVLFVFFAILLAVVVLVFGAIVAGRKLEASEE